MKRRASSERGRAVKLAIAEGQVTLTVNNPDSGSAVEEIPADYTSDPIEIGGGDLAEPFTPAQHAGIVHQQVERLLIGDQGQLVH